MSPCRPTKAEANLLLLSDHRCSFLTVSQPLFQCLDSQNLTYRIRPVPPVEDAWPCSFAASLSCFPPPLHTSLVDAVCCLVH